MFLHWWQRTVFLHLGLQVYDAGGTEFGTIESRPEELWSELACCWQRETGTILLPPEGTHLSTTAAAELQDEILIAVAIVCVRSHFGSSCGPAALAACAPCLAGEGVSGSGPAQ